MCALLSKFTWLGVAEADDAFGKPAYTPGSIYRLLVSVWPYGWWVRVGGGLTHHCGVHRSGSRQLLCARLQTFVCPHIYVVVRAVGVRNGVA